MSKPLVNLNGQWLDLIYDGQSDSGKTNIYRVQNKKNGIIIGYIKWFGAFRKYCFFPNPETVYDRSCLIEISYFLEGIK